MNLFKRLFTRKQTVWTPIGRVSLEEYERDRFIEFRTETLTERDERIIKHFNRFNESFYETHLGRGWY